MEINVVIQEFGFDCSKAQSKDLYEMNSHISPINQNSSS